MSNPDTAYTKGLLGEERAAEYLQKKGMVLLARRYRSLYGEIDLIAQDRDSLVFVEVKTRLKGAQGAGLYSVTQQKQQRLIQTASMYLAGQPWQGTVRFDVIEITPKGLLHIISAFDASAPYR